MTRDRIIEGSDWSDLPNVMFITSVRCVNSVVYEANVCSVPMAIGPEVSYVRIDAIPGLADVLDGKAVIVPVEMTEKMAGSFFNARDVVFPRQMRKAQKSHRGWASLPCVVWTTMLAASPYRSTK